MSKIIIAIDGFSSCGKSTLAKTLAARLHYTYLDSGSMYRCVTYYALQKGAITVKTINQESIIKLLPEINLSFTFNPHTKTSETFLNGQHVEKEIRSMEVAAHVSKVSAIKEVRQKLVEIQRELGKEKGIVMDGRDIGSHVFPEAELKIFMTADVNVRTQRRMDELNSKGQHVEFEEVKNNLIQRDYADSHRKESPLIKAKDAIVLDNSDLSREEQLEYVLKLMRDLMLTKD